MKWLLNLAIPFKSKVAEPSIEQNLIDLEKGKQLYTESRLDDALIYLNQALKSGFDISLCELRAKCFQELDSHYKAIEDFDKVIEENPLEFSHYYSRAVSKSAVFDVGGQIEDLHNFIYYYKKSKNIETNILKKLETDLITAKSHIEKVKTNMASIHNTGCLEIKNRINECLYQLKKIKLRSNNSKILQNNRVLLSR